MTHKVVKMGQVQDLESLLRQVSALVAESRKRPVLVCWSSHNKMPQTGRLSTAEISYLTVLEAGSP